LSPTPAGRRDDWRVIESSSDRDSGLRSGERLGVSASVAQLGRSDSASHPVGKIRVHSDRRDQMNAPTTAMGPLPKAIPAQGQPQPLLGPEWPNRRR
jgi:hypothetical protein